MTFRYTKTADLNSSAVDVAYYNDKTRDLAIALVGGGVYKYSNVPAGAFDTLTSPGQSAGRFYATSIKRNYGPGSYLGFEADKHFVQENTVSTVGTPKALAFDLGGRTEPAKVVRNSYSINFTVEGNARVKTYTTKASTLEEALDNLTEATDALGLDVKVTGGTFTFE